MGYRSPNRCYTTCVIDREWTTTQHSNRKQGKTGKHFTTTMAPSRGTLVEESDTDSKRVDSTRMIAKFTASTVVIVGILIAYSLHAHGD